MAQAAHLCDEKVYKETYEKYAADLYRFLNYHFNGAVDAEDITQNVFLKIWEQCADFHLKNIKSLLFTMGKNSGLNSIKKQNAQLGLSINEDALSAGPDSLLEEKELHHKLMQAIQDLDPNERTVFLMSRMDDLAYKEIAARLNLSQKAVEKRMHKALQKLKERTSLNLKRK